MLARAPVMVMYRCTLWNNLPPTRKQAIRLRVEGGGLRAKGLGIGVEGPGFRVAYTRNPQPSPTRGQTSGDVGGEVRDGGSLPDEPALCAA